ncbi:MAG: fluoride efflux transporter CrcB [Methanosarcinaceae archaeon]|nr:fluoride efflux transporter CrcB [Methanosarcinaceae archaeon]
MGGLEDVVLVGIGGFIGAMLRFLVAGVVPRIGEIPAGTLFVNVIGSMVLSVLTFSSQPQSAVYFVNTGILGAFTTFSTFGYETFKLLEDGESLYFILNITLNILLCLLAVGAGHLAVNLI